MLKYEWGHFRSVGVCTDATYWRSLEHVKGAAYDGLNNNSSSKCNNMPKNTYSHTTIACLAINVLGSGADRTAFNSVYHHDTGS
jgi:hypothetical protein